MRTSWEADGKHKCVVSPLSLVISVFAPIVDVGRTLTPQLDTTHAVLVLVDLGLGKNRLGGSALAQVYNQLGDQAPDIEPRTLLLAFECVTELKRADLILAYHDRSDGGLLATVCEMAFAGRCGLELDLRVLKGDDLAKLFNEEVGIVIQVRSKDLDLVLGVLGEAFSDHVAVIGHPVTTQAISIELDQQTYTNSRAELESVWGQRPATGCRGFETTRSARRLEYRGISNDADPGLNEKVASQVVKLAGPGMTPACPRVAIFREEGVNGHLEAAAAFDAVGFQSVDVHPSEVKSGRVDLEGFPRAGRGPWRILLRRRAGAAAKAGQVTNDLLQKDLRRIFARFFDRPDTFTLGICNGCQMLASLKSIIPGSGALAEVRTEPLRAVRGTTDQRSCQRFAIIVLQVHGGLGPCVPVAHGQGRAQFSDEGQRPKEP